MMFSIIAVLLILWIAISVPLAAAVGRAFSAGQGPDPREVVEPAVSEFAA